jgi:cohesin complex subunit SA-1/2
LMNINMYLELRMTSAYETLWDDVSKQLMTHSNSSIVDRAVMTIGHMLSAKSLQNINKKKMGELEEELASSIRQHAHIGKRKLDTATLKDEEVQGLQQAAYRVKSLFSVRNLVGWLEENSNGKETRLLDLFNSILQRAKLGHSNEDKVNKFISFESPLTKFFSWLN